MFKGDRSHPRLKALDSHTLTYANWLKDKRHIEECIIWEISDTYFNELIEEIQKTQAAYDAKTTQQESKTSHQTNDSEFCAICLERKITHAMVPCGHCILCENCAIELNNYKARDRHCSCPICRTPFSSIAKIFETVLMQPRLARTHKFHFDQKISRFVICSKILNK